MTSFSDNRRMTLSRGKHWCQKRPLSLTEDQLIMQPDLSSCADRYAIDVPSHLRPASLAKHRIDKIALMR